MLKQAEALRSRNETLSFDLSASKSAARQLRDELAERAEENMDIVSQVSACLSLLPLFLSLLHVLSLILSLSFLLYFSVSLSIFLSIVRKLHILIFRSYFSFPGVSGERFAPKGGATGP